MKPDQEMISQMMEDISKAYENRDFDLIHGYFLPDDNICAIGTGLHEIHYGHNQVLSFMRDVLTEDREIRYHVLQRKITIKQEIAWVIQEIRLQFDLEGNSVIMDGRVTYILEKIEKKWYIVHSHSSAPLSTQEKGHPYPSKPGLEKTISNWLDMFDVKFDFLNKHEKTEIRQYLEIIQTVFDRKD